jgi:NitT/TauT family transport system substrate-binding protein
MSRTIRATLRAGVWAALALLALPVMAAEKVSVRLDWLPGAYHAALFVAKDKGYYAEQGLDVQINNGQGSISTLQVVGSGNETIGLANISALALAAARDVPVVAIAGVIQRAPEAVITLQSSGIRTPKDLEGKRWGAVAGDEAQRLFTAFAARNKLDMRKIRRVTLNHSAAITSLVNGDVDFICAWALQDGLKISRVKPIGEPMRFADAGLNTLGTSMFVTRKTLESKPDVLKKFIAATQRGAADVAKDPQLGVDAVRRARPELSREVLAAEMQGLPPYLHTKHSAGKPFGWLAREDVEEMLQVMRDYYSLPARITADKVYTGQFVE